MANYTLNYTGEKVDELLNKIDTAFGETTVMGDTLTWDGDTEGRYNVFGMFYKVSDAMPTLADLLNGGTISYMNTDEPFTSGNVVDAESLGLGEGCIVITNVNGDPMAGVALKAGATATLNGVTVTFEETGTFFSRQQISTNAYIHIEKLTINGYTGFETTETKTIDEKYLPATSNIAITVEDYSYNSSTGSTGTVTCSKTFDELWGMSDKSLLNAVATITPAVGYKFVARIAIASKVTNDTNPDNIVQLIDFKFPVGLYNGVMHFADVVLTKDGTVGVM